MNRRSLLTLSLHTKNTFILIQSQHISTFHFFYCQWLNNFTNLQNTKNPNLVKEERLARRQRKCSLGRVNNLRTKTICLLIYCKIEIVCIPTAERETRSSIKSSVAALYASPMEESTIAPPSPLPKPLPDCSSHATPFIAPFYRFCLTD